MTSSLNSVDAQEDCVLVRVKRPRSSEPLGTLLLGPNITGKRHRKPGDGDEPNHQQHILPRVFTLVDSVPASLSKAGQKQILQQLANSAVAEQHDAADDMQLRSATAENMSVVVDVTSKSQDRILDEWHKAVRKHRLVSIDDSAVHNTKSTVGEGMDSSVVKEYGTAADLSKESVFANTTRSPRNDTTAPRVGVSTSRTNSGADTTCDASKESQSDSSTSLVAAEVVTDAVLSKTRSDLDEHPQQAVVGLRLKAVKRVVCQTRLIDARSNSVVKILDLQNETLSGDVFSGSESYKRRRRDNTTVPAESPSDFAYDFYTLRRDHLATRQSGRPTDSSEYICELLLGISSETLQPPSAYEVTVDPYTTALAEESLHFSQRLGLAEVDGSILDEGSNDGFMGHSECMASLDEFLGEFGDVDDPLSDDNHEDDTESSVDYPSTEEDDDEYHHRKQARRVWHESGDSENSSEDSERRFEASDSGDGEMGSEAWKETKRNQFWDKLLGAKPSTDSDDDD